MAQRTLHPFDGAATSSKPQLYDPSACFDCPSRGILSFGVRYSIWTKSMLQFSFSNGRVLQKACSTLQEMVDVGPTTRTVEGYELALA